MTTVSCFGLLYFLCSPYFSLTLLKYQIQSAAKADDTNHTVLLAIKLPIFLISSHSGAEKSKNGP